jgi:hypothetical protein
MLNPRMFYLQQLTSGTDHKRILGKFEIANGVCIDTYQDNLIWFRHICRL